MGSHEDSVAVTGFSQFEVESTAQRQGKSRSKACLHCRRRKMKCDGVKPACFQCLRAERGDECEYDDGVTKTGTQLLYERLAQLEKRFRDLQAARSDGTRLRRSPQTGRGVSRPMLARSASMPGRRPGVAVLHPGRPGEHHRGYVGSPEISYANLELSRSSSRSSSRSPSEWSFDGSSSANMLHAQYSPVPQVYYADQASVYSSSHESLPYNIFPEVPQDIPRAMTFPSPGHEEMGNKQFLRKASHWARDLPLETVEHLVNVVVPRGHQIGISILPNIIDNLALLIPTSEAVGYAMILWGAHFSRDPAMHDLKPLLLQRALDALPQLLSNPSGSCEADYSRSLTLGSAASNVSNALTTSIMLAIYFFAHGRFIEAAYHTTTASQLSLACGLHQMPDPRSIPDVPPEIARTGIPSPLSVGISGATESGMSGGLLPSLRTRTDALSRQHRFWNTFVLQRTWAAAGGLTAPSGHWGTAPGAQGHDPHPRTAITTPWPEDWGLLLIDDSTDSRSAPPPPLEASATPVDDFLAGRDVTPSKSFLHVRAKSAALYEAAVNVGSMYDPHALDISNNEQFSSLQFTLGAFTNSLVQIISHDFRTASFAKSSSYCTRSMAHAAIIRLNFRLAEVAYAKGAMDSPSVAFGIASARAQNAGDNEHAILIEGLLGYERAYSQVPSSAGSAQSQARDGSHSPASQVGNAIAAADKCMHSAREIVRIVGSIGPNDYEFLEPVIGSCWVTAADVLARELRRLNNTMNPEKTRLPSEIDVIVAGLKQLGAIFPIALTQAKTVSSMKNKAMKHRQPVASL